MRGYRSAAIPSGTAPPTCWTMRATTMPTAGAWSQHPLLPPRGPPAGKMATVREAMTKACIAMVIRRVTASTTCSGTGEAWTRTVESRCLGVAPNDRDRLSWPRPLEALMPPQIWVWGRRRWVVAAVEGSGRWTTNGEWTMSSPTAKRAAASRAQEGRRPA